MSQRKHTSHSQQGMTLIMLVFIVGLAATAFLLNAMNENTVKMERDKKTAASLAEAKAALLAYAAMVDTSAPCASMNCPRPGELPCPDRLNDGAAGASCGSAAGSNQTWRIGRLPWKTLGIGDLRDGHGERLWYAVSNRYKYNTRFRPLNSDTEGTITLRDSGGGVLYDGSSGTGLVAVVMASGPAIVRQDGIVQVRGGVGQENNPQNYLDSVAAEDNADFVDGNVNGFIMGPIKDAGGNEILNDRVIAITRDDMIPVMESRVLAEATNALLDYYCGNGNANYATKSCMGAGGNRFFPSPANFDNTPTTCLGTAALAGCTPNVAIAHGRIPANPPPATPLLDWSGTSILRSISNGNWFQQNGWRELIHYAVAPACSSGTVGCGGAGGLLTLNQALVLPANGKQVVLIASGRTLVPQTRANPAQKSLEANYLESENVAPLDNTYVRSVIWNGLVNDRAVSIP